MALQIKAKCFNGQSYDLSMQSTAATIADLQESISTASGITPERQTLLYKGSVLESNKTLADYALADGNTISVVRRVGKSAPKSTPAAPPASTPAAAPATMPVETEADPTAGVPPSLEDMLRSLQMGNTAAGAAAGANTAAPDLNALLGQMGAAGPNPGAMPDLSALMGAGTGASGVGFEQIFAQLPAMMNGILKSPMLREYLNNPEKQEQSRDAILNSPMMKSLLENDPEFAKVVSDPEKWKASMETAKSLISEEQEAEQESSAANSAPRGFGGNRTTASRPSAADNAPPGIDISKLSESYGHALGQSLINSGLGLDTDLVVKGLKSAVDGKSFPMALPEYERSMAALQNIAAEYLTKANLEDANNFFNEIKQEGQAVIIEEGKIAYERTDMEADTSQPQADDKSTVLVIITARLLDGRHFFTCPAADDNGDSVHPLTLPLESAPQALAKGINGMRENESRLLYVHPTACEGMADMFGDLLPPNALLIFDLQLVSANAPEEETVGESYYKA